MDVKADAYTEMCLSTQESRHIQARLPSAPQLRKQAADFMKKFELTQAGGSCAHLFRHAGSMFERSGFRIQSTSSDATWFSPLSEVGKLGHH